MGMPKGQTVDAYCGKCGRITTWICYDVGAKYVSGRGWVEGIGEERWKCLGCGKTR